jgi:hypothetical protein
MEWRKRMAAQERPQRDAFPPRFDVQRSVFISDLLKAVTAATGQTDRRSGRQMKDALTGVALFRRAFPRGGV